MNKKAILDGVYYGIGKQQYDFYVCGLYPTFSTKWKKYSEAVFPIDFDGSCSDKEQKRFFDLINQRQILPIEIVLDLEEKEQLPKVIEKLRKFKANFKVYSTGSRGYHIHLFFKEELEEEEKGRIINFFQTDSMKAHHKTMIALENTPHWKSNKLKQEIEC